MRSARNLEKNAMKPFVSIIVPVLNGARHIGKCLDSLEAVDYPRDRYEIIVIDNGSTDNTVEIVKGYRDVVLLIKTKVRVGTVRNYGATNSRGEILAFIDSDCIAARAWLQNGVQTLLNDPGTGIAGSHYLPPESCSWVGKVWRARSRYNKFMGEVTYIPGGNIFISRGHFNSIGGFNEDLVSAEDVDLCHRARMKGYRIFSNPEITVYHLGDNLTLTRFFKNEVMRGRDVVRLYLKDGRRSNLKASLIAFYYLFGFTFFASGAVYSSFYPGEYKVFAAGLTLMLLPPVVLSLLAVKKHRIYKYFFMTVLLYLAFGLARAVAVIYPKKKVAA